MLLREMLSCLCACCAVREILLVFLKWLLSTHIAVQYKSVHHIHRAVTNKVEARLSMFYGPNKDTVIGPIEDSIDEEHPPLYLRYKYAEFFEEFYKQEGKRRLVKEAFELHN
ncbi:hypothetical protein L3X38_005133 [Prunus dulcis]|uniref:Uncharacterized protein n=1 Tax=Prunus dulcis TaxID=3755 RepID=A0AAD4ZQC6_PRUDU|nr:hypothetical protein L3X38_005133 [Prunus dulcis]